MLSDPLYQVKLNKLIKIFQHSLLFSFIFQRQFFMCMMCNMLNNDSVDEEEQGMKEKIFQPSLTWIYLISKLGN